MPPPSPGPKPPPLPEPIPPPEPDPIPPPEPGPFEGGPSLASGSPHMFILLLLGTVKSGGPINVGSISSLGFGLLTTCAGGTNCRGENFGARPLLAGSGDRSPPPPPPCIVCFLGASSGVYGAMSGA